MKNFKTSSYFEFIKSFLLGMITGASFYQLKNFSLLSTLFSLNVLKVPFLKTMSKFSVIFLYLFSIILIISLIRLSEYSYYIFLLCCTVFLFIGISLIIWQILISVKSYFLDYMIYRNNNLSFVKTREDIERIYINFKTRFFKEKFVNHFEHNKPKITGNWSQDFLNITKDTYITRLAKLEEKWLKLDN